MASSRSESASSAPVGSVWWIQLNIPLKITAKCHGQYRYFIVFPLIRVSRARDGFWMIEAVERKTTRIPWCICLWMECIYFLSVSTHLSFTQQEMNYPGNGFGCRAFSSPAWRFDRRHAGWSGPTARWRATERLPPETLKCRIRLCAAEKQCVCLLCVRAFSPLQPVRDYKGLTHRKRAKDIWNLI